MTSSPEPFAFARLAPPPAVDERAQAAEREAALAAARHEGFEAGREAGRAEVEAQVREQLDAALTALAEATALLAEERVRAAQAVERKAVELALRIAEKVVAGSIEVDPARVLDVVAGALQRLVERERVTVVVSPEDLELVRQGIEDVAARLGGIEHLEVQADRRVQRGGALVRTADGEVDATIESKLERVRELVAGIVGER